MPRRFAKISHSKKMANAVTIVVTAPVPALAAACAKHNPKDKRSRRHPESHRDEGFSKISILHVTSAVEPGRCFHCHP